MIDKKTMRSFGVLALACGVCCLPLIVPVIGGLAAGGGLLALFGQGYWVAIGLAVALAGPAFMVWRKRRQTKLASTDSQCGCAPNTGCSSGDSCQLPDKAS